MADGEVGAIPSHANDVGIVRVQDPKWPSDSSSSWLKVNRLFMYLQLLLLRVKKGQG